MGIEVDESETNRIRVGTTAIRRAHVGADSVWDPDAPTIAKASEPWPGGTMTSADGTEWYEDGSPFGSPETGLTYDVVPADIGTELTRYDSVTGLESDPETVERVKGIERGATGDETVYVPASWGQVVSLIAVVTLTSANNGTFVSMEDTGGFPGFTLYHHIGFERLRLAIRTTGSSAELTLEVDPAELETGRWLVMGVIDDGDALLYARRLDAAGGGTDTDTYDSTDQTGSGRLGLFARPSGGGSESAGVVEAVAIAAAFDATTADGWTGDLVADGLIGHASEIEHLSPDSTVEDGDTVTAGDVDTDGGTPVIVSGTSACTHGGLNVAI